MGAAPYCGGDGGRVMKGRSVVSRLLRGSLRLDHGERMLRDEGGMRAWFCIRCDPVELICSSRQVSTGVL